MALALSFDPQTTFMLVQSDTVYDDTTLVAYFAAIRAAATTAGADLEQSLVFLNPTSPPTYTVAFYLPLAPWSVIGPFLTAVAAL